MRNFVKTILVIAGLVGVSCAQEMSTSLESGSAEQPSKIAASSRVDQNDVATSSNDVSEHFKGFLSKPEPIKRKLRRFLSVQKKSFVQENT